MTEAQGTRGEADADAKLAWQTPQVFELDAPSVNGGFLFASEDLTLGTPLGSLS